MNEFQRQRQRQRNVSIELHFILYRFGMLWYVCLCFQNFARAHRFFVSILNLQRLPHLSIELY